VQPIIDWLAQNEALAGWAQMLGSLIALAVAIALPALERRSANDAALTVAAATVLEALLALEIALSVVRRGELGSAEIGAARSYVLRVLGTLRSVELWRLEPKVAIEIQAATRSFGGVELIWLESIGTVTTSVLPESAWEGADTMADLADDFIDIVMEMGKKNRRKFGNFREMAASAKEQVERVRAELKAPEASD